MKPQYLLAALLLTGSSTVWAQNYFDDDIYYNPKKSSNVTVSPAKKEKKSNYIKDFTSIDVDSYNRRGQYYRTPADTIGEAVENGEDFVYTQQIQRFYNPTIVVDNAYLLEDILNNSYGNVTIELDASGLPVFSRWGGYWYNSWGPGWNLGYYDPWYGPGWGPSWAWGPSWSWNWGPSWTWGPSWSWGWNWGPSWAWGPSWNWGWGWSPSFGVPGWAVSNPVANYRPNGNRPSSARPGWSENTRPSIGPSASHRTPGGSVSRPSNARPANNSGVVNNNGRWEYVNGGHRVTPGTPGSSTYRGGNNSTNNRQPANSSVTNNHRQPTRSTTNRTELNNSNRNQYNSNNNRSYNNTTRSSGTMGGGTHGGSFGGSRSGGSTGGGRHR